MRAPAPTAAGSMLRSIESFAPLGHPALHRASPWHPEVLRRVGRWLRPSRSAPSGHEQVVPARDSWVGGGHAEERLDLRTRLVERLPRQLVAQGGIGRHPFVVHVAGKTPADGRVDHRRPAQGASVEQLHGRPAPGEAEATAVVELGQRFQRIARQLVGLHPGTSLEDDHVRAGRAQVTGHRCATGPTADHDDVTTQPLVTGQVPAVEPDEAHDRIQSVVRERTASSPR